MEPFFALSQFLTVSLFYVHLRFSVNFIFTNRCLFNICFTYALSLLHICRYIYITDVYFYFIPTVYTHKYIYKYICRVLIHLP